MKKKLIDGVQIIATIAFLASVGYYYGWEKVGIDHVETRSFSQAKRYLDKEVYNTPEKRTTFYCGCKYDENGKIDHKSCDYKHKGSLARASKMEWEHIVPASVFGQKLLCWQNGGRSNCAKVSPEFKKFEGDIRNLVPSVGEINGRRGSVYFGEIPGEKTFHGACDFEIGKVDGERIAEPPNHLKGIISKIWLTMLQEYNILIPERHMKTLNEWNTKYN